MRDLVDSVKRQKHQRHKNYFSFHVIILIRHATAQTFLVHQINVVTFGYACCRVSFVGDILDTLTRYFFNDGDFVFTFSLTCLPDYFGCVGTFGGCGKLLLAWLVCFIVGFLARCIRRVFHF